MITKRQYYFINFFLIKSLFIAGGYSLIFNISNTSSFLCGILGMLLGLLVIFIFNKLNLTKRLSLDFYNVFSSLTFLLLLSLIFHNSIISLLTLIGNFFLIKTPIYFMLIPLLIVCYYAASKNIQTVARVAEIIFIIRIILFILKLIGFIPLFQIDNILPIMNLSISNFAHSTYIFFTYFTTTLFISNNLKVYNLKPKDHIISFIIPSLITILMFFLITCVLGEPLINILKFPEYTILKKINIFGSINNIENMLLINLIFDIVVTLFVSATTIKEIFHKYIKKEKIQKRIFILWITLMFISLNFIFFHDYKLILKLNKIYPYLLTGLSILLIISSIMKKKKN